MTAPAVGGSRVRTDPPRPRWLPRIDAVTALTAFLVLSFAIPSPLIFKPLGGSGTPGNLLGLAFLLWWALAKLGSGLGVDRGRQPVRIALLLFILPVLTSLAALYFRPFVESESTGAQRGIVYLASLSGVALLAADGITSIARVHVLMKRVVLGVSAMATLGLVEFFTGWNPALTLHIPGLVRNIDIVGQGRSNFVRVQATTLHPIEFGALLGMVLPVAVHYGLMAKGRRARRRAWLQVGLIGAVLPMALSRTGVIAASVGLLAVAADWGWDRRLKALAIVVVFLTVMRAAVPGLVGSLLSLFTKFDQDNSTKLRQERYGIAGHYFLQHPWFGRGYNTLYPATKQVFDNAYLYVATEMGAVGIVLTLLFFLIIICTARGARLRSTDLETKGLSQALAGAFLAMMIMYGTADIMSFTILIGVFFLMVGVAGALWRLNGGAGPPAPSRWNTPEIRVRRPMLGPAGGAG